VHAYKGFLALIFYSNVKSCDVGLPVLIKAVRVVLL